MSTPLSSLLPPPSSLPPLKVMMVMDTRNWAGTESYIQTLALALRALNAGASEGEMDASPQSVIRNPQSAIVMVATPRDSALWARAHEAGLPVVAIARRQKVGLDTLQILTRRLRRGDADVIHAHNGRTSLLSALAVRLARRGACVLTHHFITPAHSQGGGALNGWKSSAHSRLANGIAGHIAISQAVAQAILARGEVPPARLTVVYNGIEIPSLLPPPSSSLPAELRAEIVGVARLQKEKDLPTLVRALQILRDERRETAPRCVIAGEGEERENLETLIREANLGDIVHLAGFTPHAAALMRAARVFVLPSVAEPFGLALVEAMAQKRPVVAIDSGGPREIVVEGETGFLVPPRDAPAMARAIAALLDDPAQAEAMGQAGFERFQTHFTSRRMAQETLAVYQRALRPCSSEKPDELFDS